MHNSKNRKINKKYKVIVADDHSLIRSGIKLTIKNDEDFVLIDEFENGVNLVQTIIDKKCDLAIIDLMMPEIDGMQVLKEIKKKKIKVKTIIITLSNDINFFKDAVKLGVDGYFTKEDDIDFLLLAMKSVMKNMKVYSPKFQNHLFSTKSKTNKYNLSEREIEILSQLTNGSTSKEIADNLNISKSTVEYHKKNLKQKLNRDSLADLISYANKYLNK